MLTIADIPLLDIISAKALDNYRVLVEFEDGKRGIYDMTPYLDKGVFRALKDPAVFNAVHIEYGTIAWPGELDIAPERVYTDMVELS